MYFVAGGRRPAVAGRGGGGGEATFLPEDFVCGSLALAFVDVASAQGGAMVGGAAAEASIRQGPAWTIMLAAPPSLVFCAD